MGAKDQPAPSTVALAAASLTNTVTSVRQKKPQRFRHTRRLGIVRFLAVNLFLLIVPAAICYVVITQRHTREEIDRSFRNVSQIEFRFRQQFSRLSGFVVSLINRNALVRCDVDSAKTPECIAAAKGKLVTPLSGESSIDTWLTSLRDQARNASIRNIEVVDSEEQFEQVLKAAGVSFTEVGAKSTKNEHVRDATARTSENPLDLVQFGIDRAKPDALTLSVVPSKGASPRLPRIRVAFQNLLADFSIPREFAGLYLVSRSGTILASVGQTKRTNPAVELQPDLGSQDYYSDFTRIFSKASNEEKASDNYLSKEMASLKPDTSGAAKPTSEAPDQEYPSKPIVVQDRTGENSFQLFIQPFDISSDVNWKSADCPHEESAGSTAASGNKCKSDSLLYLIALKEDRTVQEALSQLGPLSASGLGLIICLLLLCVPIIRVSFLEAHDSISKSWLTLTIVCATLFIGVLAIAALAVRMDRDQTAIMDAARNRAADQIAGSLTEDVKRHVSALEQLDKQVFYQLPTKDNAEANGGGGFQTSDCNAVIRGLMQKPITLRELIEDDGAANGHMNERLLALSPFQDHSESDCHQPLLTRTLGPKLVPEGSQPYPWSTLQSAWATDANGDMRGPRLDFYNRYDHRNDNGINLAFRPYFKKLAIGQGWHVDSLIGLLCQKHPQNYAPFAVKEFCDIYGEDSHYVVQRLFNLGDGEKLAQFAIDRHSVLAPGGAGKTGRYAFSGIVSGEVRLSSVVDAVLPFGLKFAVIERNSGLVIYHSDDSRSLGENFVSEVRAVDFKSVLNQAAPYSFVGEYHGKPTRFRSVALTDPIPWNVIVFYDPTPGQQTVLLAALTSLIALSSALLFSVLVCLAIAKLAGERFSWAWPQWRLRETYIWFALFEGGFLCIEYVSMPYVGNPWHFATLFLSLWVLATCASSLLSPNTVKWQRRRMYAFAAHIAGFVGFSVIALTADRPMTEILLIALLCLAYVSCYVAYFRWLFRDPQFGYRTYLSAYNPWMARPRPLLQTKHAFKSPIAAQAFSRLARGLNHPGTVQFRRRYLICVGIAMTGVVILPGWDLFRRAADLHSGARFDLDLKETAAALASRRENFDSELTRLLGFGHRNDVSDFQKPPSALVRRGVYLIGGGADQPWSLTPSTYLGPKVARVCAPRAKATTGWESVVWSTMPTVSESSSIVKIITTDSTPYARHFPSHIQETYAGATIAAERPSCVDIGALEANRYAEDVVYDGLPLGVLLLGYAFLTYVARRVLGTDIPWFGQHGAMGRKLVPGAEWSRYRFAMLIRPTPAALACPAGAKKLDLMRWPTAEETPEKAAQELGAEDVQLFELDRAVLNPQRRLMLIDALEVLVDRPAGNVQLIVQLPPLFRILKPTAFPDVSEDDRPTDAEVARWADLMSKFRKVYRAGGAEIAAGRSPDVVIIGDTQYLRLREFIIRECSVVRPNLNAIRDELFNLLDATLDGSCSLSDHDVLEYMEAHGGPIFRKHWQLCTREERLALYQLASGRYINPTNENVIAHLYRKQLIVFEPSPRIKSRAFANFVLRAELPGEFEEWSTEAAEGVWQTIRTPLLIIVLMLIAWLAWSAGDIFQALTAVLISTLTFFTQLMRAVGYARSPTAIADR